MHRELQRCSFAQDGQCHHSQTPMIPAKGYCEACQHYSGPPRGLGDTVHAGARMLGIRPCKGCGQRSQVLNKVIPYGT